MKNLQKSLVTGGIIFASMTIAQTSIALTLNKSVDFSGKGPDVSSLFFDLDNSLELTVTAGVHGRYQIINLLDK